MFKTFSRVFFKSILSICTWILLAATETNAQACVNDTAIITTAVSLPSGSLPTCRTVIVRAPITITGNYTAPTTITNFIIDTQGSLNYQGNGNISLTFGANTVFRVIGNNASPQNQVTATQCNNQKAIFIGTLEFANCNGSNAGGQNRYSFDELVQYGGPAAVNPTYTPLCTGTTLNLQANFTGGDPAQRTVTWTGPVGAVFSPNANAANPTVTPAVAGIYTATATDGFVPGYSQQKSITVVIAPQVTFTTQPTPANITLNLGATGPTYTVATSGGVAPVTYQWYKNTVNSTIGATLIPNATGTSAVPPTTTPDITYYFCVASSAGSGCTSATSNIVRVAILDVKQWNGSISTDWNNPLNWTPNSLPGSGSDVVIPPPPAAPNQPVLPYDVIVKDVQLAAGGSITLNGFSFTANGPFTANGTIVGSNSSSLYLRGQTNNTTLRFDTASIPPDNRIDTSRYTLRNLYISGNGVTTLGTPLNIYPANGTVDLEQGHELATGGYLTLMSSSLGSSYIKDLTDNGTGRITGNATVERYYTAGRKWRLANAAVEGATNNSVYYNWQNNGVIGYRRGAEIWAPNNVVSYVQPTLNSSGYAGGPTPGSWSLKGVNNSTGVITLPPSTKADNTLFTAGGPIPYFLFPTSPFRDGGGRIVSTSGSEDGVLRATGSLVQGNKVYGYISSSSNRCFLVPNPYAARVDFALLPRVNLLDRIWVWDPRLSGTNGVGAYQLVDLATNTVTPGGGSYPAFSSVIESGQAFFVESTIDGVASLTFQESAKVAGPEIRQMGKTILNDLTQSTAGSGKQVTRLKATLTDPAQGNAVLDGILVQFENNGVIDIDGGDAIKFPNSGENLSVRQLNKDLVLERRPMPTESTIIPLRLWNTRQQNYNLKLAPVQSAWGYQATATLEDAFLGTSTPLSAAAPIDYAFSVTSSTASTGNRFRIVASQQKLEFAFAQNTAEATDMNQTQLAWKVSNEFFQQRYTIERSRDGQMFSTLSELAANNAGTENSYAFADGKPFKGKSFYRIKTIDADGAIKYSAVMEVMLGGQITKQPRKALQLYPNPVKGSQTNLSFTNLSKGEYEVTVIGQNGRILANRNITHMGKDASYGLNLPTTLGKGKYELRIKQGGQVIQTINFIKE